MEVEKLFEGLEIVEDSGRGGVKWKEDELREFVNALLERAKEKGVTEVFIPYEVLKEFRKDGKLSYKGKRFGQAVRVTIASITGIDKDRIHEASGVKYKLNGKVGKGGIKIDVE